MIIPSDLLPALYEYGNIAHEYLLKHLTDDQISAFFEYLHKPETTHGEAYRQITQEHRHPETVFYALESLARINALCNAAECPSETPIEPEKAFIVAFSALRAGMLIGAIVEDKGKAELIELERSLRRKISKIATDAKYEDRRMLLKRARTVVRQLWESGDNRKHHEMKKYLIEEYQDETGKHPFIYLKEKSLLDACKQVAKEINRPDLISGQKKSS